MKKDDKGFTLVELSISMMIMLVIIAALVGVMATVTSQSSQSTKQVDASFDQQTLTTYFASDVQSTLLVSQCDSVGTSNTTVVLHRLDSSEVSYVRVADTLVRQTTSTTDVIARDVKQVTYAAGTMTITFNNDATATATGKGRMTNAQLSC